MSPVRFCARPSHLGGRTNEERIGGLFRVSRPAGLAGVEPQRTQNISSQLSLPSHCRQPHAKTRQSKNLAAFPFCHYRRLAAAKPSSSRAGRAAATIVSHGVIAAVIWRSVANGAPYGVTSEPTYYAADTAAHRSTISGADRSSNNYPIALPTRPALGLLLPDPPDPPELPIAVLQSSNVSTSDRSQSIQTLAKCSTTK